jgi:hypothetical protein
MANVHAGLSRLLFTQEIRVVLSLFRTRYHCLRLRTLGFLQKPFLWHHAILLFAQLATMPGNV